MTDRMPVRVITSARRRKTVSARIVDGTIEVRMPEGLSARERDRHVSTLVSKLERQHDASRIDLVVRASSLARKHSLPTPDTITWSSRQQTRWGSCTPSMRAIRISERLAQYPMWVLDYVIVHELAHLVEPDHSAAFHELANRYVSAERAKGFLAAVSLGHAGRLSGVMDEEVCIEHGDPS